MRFKAKPLRSVMFVPGNREDWMRKAHQYGPDALILDLEDSVPEDEKEKARSLVAGMVDELGSAGQTLFVRVNRLETGLTGFDLEAVTSPHLYGILLPKVERPEDVVEVDTLLRFFERKAGMAIGSICIDPALETAHGIRQAYDIAMASDRVAHMGGSGGKGGDTARSIGFQWTPEGMETLFIKSKVLVDSRSAGIEFPHQRGLVRYPRPGRPARPGQPVETTGVHRNEPHPPVPRSGGQRGVHPRSRANRSLEGFAESHGGTEAGRQRGRKPTPETWWTSPTKKPPAPCWRWSASGASTPKQQRTKRLSQNG